MSFRRDGKTAHDEQQAWDAWLAAHQDLIDRCGLPPGVFSSRRDWTCLLENGYWCEHYFGSHVGNIDFDLDSLTPTQRVAFRELLEQTLTDDQKRWNCAAWHLVNPPRLT